MQSPTTASHVPNTPNAPKKPTVSVHVYVMKPRLVLYIHL
jgi:hypothetical protein